MLYNIISGFRAEARRTFTVSQFCKTHLAPFFRFEAQLFLTLPGPEGERISTPLFFRGRKEPGLGRDNNRAVLKLGVRKRPELRFLITVSN